MMRQCFIVAGLAVVAACTPVSSNEAEDAPVQGSALTAGDDDGSQPTPGTSTGDVESGCNPPQPAAIEVPTIATPPSDLRAAARWSKTVHAKGGYAHRVAIDANGDVAWAHDSGSRRFTVTKLTGNGEQLWHRELEPPGLEPEALYATSTGGVLVAGPDLSDEPGGPKIVGLDAGGQTAWQRPVPRVQVRVIDQTADGRVVVLGSSGRREVELGRWRMTNRWLPPGGSMDIVAVLDRNGEVDWARAYFPGALGMVVHHDAIFVAGNFGRASVDYGRGSADGPGVAAKLTLNGQHVWSRSFSAGLRGVVDSDDEVDVVGFPGAGHADTTWLAPIDDRGCPGPYARLEHAAVVLAASDGSYVTYGRVQSRSWQITKVSSDFETRWSHTVDCDDLHAAVGPRETVAVSCFTSVSDTPPLKRHYELLVR